MKGRRHYSSGDVAFTIRHFDPVMRVAYTQEDLTALIDLGIGKPDASMRIETSNTYDYHIWREGSVGDALIWMERYNQTPLKS